MQKRRKKRIKDYTKLLDDFLINEEKKEKEEKERKEKERKEQYVYVKKERRNRDKQNMKDDSIHFLYIISNSSFQNSYKIGVTFKIGKRLSAFQTGDPERKYKIEFVFSEEKDYVYYIEEEILKYFSQNVKSEWIIDIDLKDIINLIELYK